MIARWQLNKSNIKSRKINHKSLMCKVGKHNAQTG